MLKVSLNVHAKQAYSQFLFLLRLKLVCYFRKVTVHEFFVKLKVPIKTVRIVNIIDTLLDYFILTGCKARIESEKIRYSIGPQ